MSECPKIFRGVTTVGQRYSLTGPYDVPRGLARLVRNAKYRVLQYSNDPFCYQLADGSLIPLPHLYLTDKGSVPPGLQWIIPKDAYQDAFILHDLLFSLHGYLSYDPESETLGYVSLTLGEANRILRQYIRDHNGIWVDAALTMMAVTIGGWIPWLRWHDREAAEILIESTLAAKHTRYIRWPVPVFTDQVEPEYIGACV